MIRNLLLIFFFFSLVAGAHELQTECKVNLNHILNDALGAKHNLNSNWNGADYLSVTPIEKNSIDNYFDLVSHDIDTLMEATGRDNNKLTLLTAQKKQALKNKTQDNVEIAKINQELGELTKHINANKLGLEHKIKIKLTEGERKKDFFGQFKSEEFDSKIKIDITRKMAPQNLIVYLIIKDNEPIGLQIQRYGKAQVEIGETQHTFFEARFVNHCEIDKKSIALMYRQNTKIESCQGLATNVNKETGKICRELSQLPELKQLAVNNTETR